MSISNPLPDALKHFEVELSQTLVRAGYNPSSLSTRGVEDKAGVRGKIAKLGNAIRNSRLGSENRSTVIQCWPSFGLLEPILWTPRAGQSFVIFHDPIPIRSQVGFDRGSRFAASRWRTKNAPNILVHSDDAFVASRQLFPHLTIRKALHPILTEIEDPADSGEEVVVAGQFKPERNLDLLIALGLMLRAKGLRPKIYGRGWPTDIPGWDVDSRFLSEAELDAAIDRAAVVLIPYKNYFQSGIAIRALERGRLSVSPKNSFAMDVFRACPGAIYEPSASPESVLECLLAVASAPEAARKIFMDYQQRTDASWASALGSDATSRATKQNFTDTA